MGSRAGSRVRRSLKGHADFLAEPNPGLRVRFDLQNVPLASLQPVSHHANLPVQGGVLAARGETELAPGVRVATLEDLQISGLKLDYLSPPASPAAPAATPAPASRPGQDHLAMRIDRLRIVRSEFGFQNRSKNPPYRVFLDQAELELDGYDGAFGKRPATATLSGRFMGSWPASASLRIFDVAGGEFSLYSELRVRNGNMAGYVKPLFRDMLVYSAAQDEHKGLFKKFYEGFIGVVAVKAILPGLQRNLETRAKTVQRS